MKNKHTIVSDLKWNHSEEERSMFLFYTIEAIKNSLDFIERNIHTDNENDMHRMAQLTIIEDQLACMTDYISVRNKALQTA